MIEARGVIVACHRTELATRGQINTIPNRTTTARISALSISKKDQNAVGRATAKTRSSPAFLFWH
jgi:hypothetical protein